MKGAVVLEGQVAIECAALVDLRRFFGNRVLLEQVGIAPRIRRHQVSTHRHVPANNAGLALGHAVIAQARALAQY